MQRAQQCGSRPARPVRLDQHERRDLPGIRWEFEKRLAAVIAANQELASEVRVLAGSEEAARKQLSTLTNELQRTRVLDQRLADEIRAPMQGSPEVDFERLERVDQILRRAREAEPSR
jgi:hypothetical protein